MLLIRYNMLFHRYSIYSQVRSGELQVEYWNYLSSIDDSLQKCIGIKDDLWLIDRYDVLI